MIKKIKSIVVFVFLFSSLPLQSFSQNNELKTYTFNVVDSLNTITPKSMVIFFHTDWCKYCAQMLSVTLKDKEVIKHLNENFYFISFDAESNEEVLFAGERFNFKPSGNNTGVHEITKQLATIDGNLAYPTLSILNEKYEIIFQRATVLSIEELILVLEKI